MERNNDLFSILLVDTSPDDLIFFRRSLEKNSLFPSSVDIARTIPEASAKLRANQYHLLLVESKLEEEDGLNLLDAMKEAGIELPFILMTPIHDDLLAKEAIKRGVSEVLIKNESQFHELAEKLMQAYNNFHSMSHEKRPANQKISEKDSRELVDKIAEAAEAQQEPAIKDELTGVFSHGYMQERIAREFSRASRYGYPISCLMLDVDHFKVINEERGYRVGDLLLQETAQLLFDTCRLSDVIARYGGTEFLILLPHVSYAGALVAAKRLRTTFASHAFLADTEDINITVSIGISSFPEDEMSRRADLLTYARRALLQSKATGRNRCTLFKEMEPVVLPRIPKLELKEDKIISFQRRISEVADKARRDYLQVSRDLLHALESKDRFTAGHGANTAKYAKQIADSMGLSVEEGEIIENGTLLHDVGKICIPDAVLLKPAKLNLNEFEVMKQHTYYGYKILKGIKFFGEEALIVLHHHEWFNGEGYPCHFKGDEIPLGARICSVVDAYDTMKQAGGRYKKTVSVKDAVAELVNLSGVQFDPGVVKVFIEVLIGRKELEPDGYDKAKLEQVLQAIAVPKAAA